MSNKRPSAKTARPADRYAGPGERIVEVYSAKLQKGCLISIRETPDGLLSIEPYRADPGVVTRVGGHSFSVSS